MLAYGEEAHRLREPAGHLLGRALDPAGVPVVRAAVLGEQGPVRGPGTVVHGRGVPGDHLIDGKPVQYGRECHALCHRPSLGHAAREAKSRAAVYEAVWGGERGPVGPLYEARWGTARLHRPVRTGGLAVRRGGRAGDRRPGGRPGRAAWFSRARRRPRRGRASPSSGPPGTAPARATRRPCGGRSPSGRPSPTRPPGSATRSR